MFELLKQQNADVLCLQKFITSTNPEYYDNIEKKYKKNWAILFIIFRLMKTGIIIITAPSYLRYPIVDSGRLRYPRPTLPRCFIACRYKSE